MIATQTVQETEPDQRSEGENVYLPFIQLLFFLKKTFAHGK